MLFFQICLPHSSGNGTISKEQGKCMGFDNALQRRAARCVPHRENVYGKKL